MNVKIVEKTKDMVKLDISGEVHILGNLLREELFNDKNVTFAGYSKEHPELDNALFVVKVKSGDPLTAVKDAVKRINSNFKELRKLLK